MLHRKTSPAPSIASVMPNPCLSPLHLPVVDFDEGDIVER
jgi:hypothetical protein